MSDRIVVDALGQTLSVGDDVAYVSRHGSSVWIKRRTIGNIDWQDLPEWRAEKEEPFLNFDDSNRKVMPYNTVRVPKDV